MLKPLTLQSKALRASAVSCQAVCTRTKLLPDVAFNEHAVDCC